MHTTCLRRSSMALCDVNNQLFCDNANVTAKKVLTPFVWQHTTTRRC